MKEREFTALLFRLSAFWGAALKCAVKGYDCDKTLGAIDHSLSTRDRVILLSVCLLMAKHLGIVSVEKEKR